MKATEIIEKTLIIRKNGYELRYKVEKVTDFDGTHMLEGVITEASESCPYNIGDNYYITETEFKSKNYPVLSK